MTYHEWQFDGLIGPTHNYAGLSPGNVASLSNAGSVSNPRAAALQGLEKMRFVQSLGIKQAFLPPQVRPVLPLLHRLGFRGTPSEVLARAHKTAPDQLAAAYSASAMWSANAATIIPSPDSHDGRVHFIPANLISHTHRAIEADVTAAQLRRIFSSKTHFAVHDPLPATRRFSDEGAANHMRVCSSHGARGAHVMIYGSGQGVAELPVKFLGRQTNEACDAIFRLGGVDGIMAQQHPKAIDAGVFHHDVIGMNTTSLMIHHQHALLDKQEFIESVKKQTTGFEFHYIEIENNDLSLDDAVKSYFFNSQLLELSTNRFAIVAPTEAQENHAARQSFERLKGNGPIEAVHYLNVRESMRNGGGPACLRLRVVLSEEEAAAMHQGIILTDAKYEALKAWITTHYRDRLHPDDLRDAALIDEVSAAHEALEWIVWGAAD